MLIKNMYLIVTRWLIGMSVSVAFLFCVPGLISGCHSVPRQVCSTPLITIGALATVEGLCICLSVLVRHTLSPLVKLRSPCVVVIAAVQWIKVV